MYQKKVPNLYLRKGVYYFRFKFSEPTRIRLKKWEICKSLKTSNFDNASVICLELRLKAKEFDKMIGALTVKELTKELADELVQKYFWERYEVEKDFLGYDLGAGSLDVELELSGEEKTKIAMTNEIMSKKFSLMTTSEAEELLLENNIKFPPPGLLKRGFMEGLVRARYELYRIFIETIKGNFDKRAIKEELFLDNSGNQSSKGMQVSGLPDNQKFQISTIIKKYILKKSNKPWTKKTIEENTRCLRWFDEMFGGKNIKKISKDNMRNLRDIIEEIPKNYVKDEKLKNLPMHEAVKVNHGKSVIAPKTAKKYWGVIGAFMNWANKEGYIDHSPALGLEIYVENNALEDKDPLSPEQLRIWFSSPIYRGCKSPGRRLMSGKLIIKDALFWVPLIGLYMGMRLGEIIQMALGDLKKVNEIWVFEVKPDPDDPNKSVKSKSSIRKVPLHRQLLALGFIEYWEEQKKSNTSRIFEEIKPSNKGYYSDNFSKKFSRRMKNLKIKTDKTSYHSLRHNIKDAMKDKDILDTHQDAILGHAQIGMNAIYGSSEIKKLKECIDKVEYDIDLSHLVKK